MKAIVLSLLVALASAPTALAATAEADMGLDAPICQGPVSVRCAYGNTFCILYVNLVVRECYHL